MKFDSFASAYLVACIVLIASCAARDCTYLSNCVSLRVPKPPSGTSVIDCGPGRKVQIDDRALVPGFDYCGCIGKTTGRCNAEKQRAELERQIKQRADAIHEYIIEKIL